MRIPAIVAAGLCMSFVVPVGEAGAQIAVSANENKVVLVDGVQTVVRNPPSDTVTVLDLASTPPRVVAELNVPTSIVGPPESVAIAPDGSFALVTAATKIDPADPSRTVPDNRVTVVALGGGTPRVTATLEAGAGASGVSINRAGTLALVANRIEGTVSVFAIAQGVLKPAGKVDLGAPDSGPSHVAITPDGRTALVTRNNDSLITVLNIAGTTVTHAKRDFAGGFKPYGIEITPDGTLAIAAHVGAGATGGVDTISVIDLTASPAKTIDQVAAGPTVEGITIAPDGRHVAATIMDGSNLPPSSPFYRRAGRLQIFAIEKQKLRLVAEAESGRWCQGVAWNRTGTTVVVQCAADREIIPFTFDGRALVRGQAVRVTGGPSGIRTADAPR